MLMAAVGDQVDCCRRNAVQTKPVIPGWVSICAWQIWSGRSMERGVPGLLQNVAPWPGGVATRGREWISVAAISIKCPNVYMKKSFLAKCRTGTDIASASSWQHQALPVDAPVKLYSGTRADTVQCAAVDFTLPFRLDGALAALQCHCSLDEGYHRPGVLDRSLSVIVRPVTSGLPPRLLVLCHCSLQAPDLVECKR
jgi:hypothetical protein